jgi:hypothetical protein
VWESLFKLETVSSDPFGRHTVFLKSLLKSY